MSPAVPDLGALAARLAGPPLTRFAPAPTGFVHLGHVVNAIYVWGLARALGGRVLLRVEDHDRVRSRPAFEAALVEDLAWLGFEPDAGASPLLRQSDAPHAYADAVAGLARHHAVYACACSRTSIGGERYDGRCRDRGLRAGPGLGLRVRLGPDPERFEDARLGPQVQTPADQCGDLLLRDRDGHWTYQLAVTVDDRRQAVTLVVRGEDLLASTGRQVALARLLGRATPPVFLHHPLLLDSGGRKLSKSASDTGVRELRAAGLAPAEVIGMAAAAVGLLEDGTPVPAARVAALFARPRPGGSAPRMPGSPDPGPLR
jgi:glutamyl-tRNA synthetase/glutamyl-Q tRNA(Asp) synthetase